MQHVPVRSGDRARSPEVTVQRQFSLQIYKSMNAEQLKKSYTCA